MNLSLPLAAGLLGAGLALGSLLAPPAGPRVVGVAETTPVVGVTAVCPDLRQDPGLLETRISVGAAPVPGPPATTSGQVDAIALRDTGTPAVLPLVHPGQVAVGLGASLNGDALVVNARGPLAAGLEVEQVTRGDRGPGRGFSGLRCQAPTTESWFVGGSTLVGDDTLLVMANTDDSPALVDVTVFTASGPTTGRAGEGLPIGPHQRGVIELDTIAPDRDLLAVHVKVRRGRVAAALRHTRWDGHTSRGVEWVPQALPPSRQVVVPGLPSGPGRRTILINNPGLDDAVVSVRLTTGDGQFVPTGLDALPVPAGTTVSREITDILANTPAAVQVTSNGPPVLAGAFVYDAQEGKIREFSYAGSARPLSGVAEITDLVINRPTESTLLLSALGDRDASVDVTPVPIVGSSAPLPPAKTIKVPSGRTVVLHLSTFLKPGATGRLAVEIRPTPGSGPVYAARYLREHGAKGPLTTLLDLQGAAQRVLRPMVSRDVGTAPLG